MALVTEQEITTTTNIKVREVLATAARLRVASTNSQGFCSYEDFIQLVDGFGTEKGVSAGSLLAHLRVRDGILDTRAIGASGGSVLDKLIAQLEDLVPWQTQLYELSNPAVHEAWDIMHAVVTDAVASDFSGRTGELEAEFGKFLLHPRAYSQSILGKLSTPGSFWYWRPTFTRTTSSDVRPPNRQPLSTRPHIPTAVIPASYRRKIGRLFHLLPQIVDDT